MLRRLIIICLLITGMIPVLFAQKNKMNPPYQKEWARADSLINRGLPKSATTTVQKILEDAQAKKDSPNAIKAQLFLMSAGIQTEENTDETVQIKKAESFINTTAGTEKAVWQSITASLYWNYFNNNRWKFYQRTTLAETKSDDIATWDAPAFFTRIAALFIASVEDRASLQSIPVERYAPLISEGHNTRNLRPTMYDLLVFRAIDFFRNDEKSITQAADQFEMEGTLWFEDAARFSSVRVKVKDGSSLHFQALQLYQEAIAFHLQDSKPDALIDADLQRLDFVHTYSRHGDKDSLYLDALQKLEQKYKDNPAVAQVSYLVAVQQMGVASLQPRSGRKIIPGTPLKHNRNLPVVKTKLQQIVQRYPGTEGAVNARNLLQSLDAIELAVKTEAVNTPAENIRALVTYKNQSRVFLRLYHLPNNTRREDNVNSEELLAQLKKMRPEKQWEQALPGTEDMEQHNTEINIGSLGTGAYLLVASSAPELETGQQVVTAASFQVSSLSFITESSDRLSGYVLHRKTGYPVADVRVQFWSQRYNSKKQKYELRLIQTAGSAADGKVAFPADNANDYENRVSAVTFISGKDTLQVDGYFNNYDRSDNVNKEAVFTRSFLFTDRSLYRPGQTIYFKGIVLKSSHEGKDNEVLAGQKTIVNLYDANHQKVQSIELTTNEYGSYSGKFTAPEGGLTGQMRIEDGHGNTYLSVEEYKRPKFYTEFDTLKDSYSLNQEVKVKGLVKAYAGNMIGDAAVKYRVVRRARFPYYWCFYRFGMPSSPEVEITHGETITKEDGSFDVIFNTLPDKAVDAGSLPVFSYTVYADVTDINGETRSGSTTVQAGYRSLQISAAVAEDSRPKDLGNIAVRTENLNGVFVPATVSISIAPLTFPGFYRKRLWETPDQFAMTETAFRQAFPADEYKEESNYMNWEAGKVLFEKTVTTTVDGAIAIPESTWYRNGWYVITVTGKDAQGKEIEEKKYTHVWAPGKKEPVQKDFVSYTEKDSYQPGDDIALWHATAVDNPYLLTRGGKADGPMRVDPSLNPWNYKLKEEDRGGMVFSWLYVADNRVYTAGETISIPWSNKDLQLEWASHRDKLQPGAAEEWTLTIKGNKKEQVAAELLAGMYDASLDAFSVHQWNWSKLFPSVYQNADWGSNYGFGMSQIRGLKYPEYNSEDYYKEYDAIDMDGQYLAEPRHMRLPDAVMANKSSGSVKFTPPVLRKNESVATDQAPVPAASAETESKVYGNVGTRNELTASSGMPDNKEEPVQVRKNLQETAFFFPQIATDANGNVQVKFTMPEALTEWKFMAFAHTRDWKTGYLEGKVKTQKDLMVVPNLPRFLRQNDDIVISAKISNLSAESLNGTATLEILDAASLKPVALPFRLTESSKTFTVAKGQSSAVTWAVHVPGSMYTPVVIRIVARAGNFSDGEENTLPVITNRTLVTETMPMPVRGSSEQTFTLDKLLHQQSNTLSNHAFTVEFTGNPAWYAVQALPYLMEYPYECAEQTFNRYYANALAGHIVAQSPKVAAVFEQWKNQDTAALLSNLQKNEELKSALLEETPWVMDAQDETEQKHRIAALFATHKLAKELNKNISKLEQMQLSEGGFPWFKGMRSDRYITQYIITGIARLQHLQVKSAADRDMERIVEKALPYLDRMLKEDYESLLRNKAKLDQQQISFSHIQYLYMRSFFTDKQIPAASKKAFDFYKKQAGQYWNRFNPYQKGQIALALQRLGDQQAPGQIIASLRETAVQSQEMGMYWKDMPNGYWWYEAPVEAQSLLVETFTEVAKDNAAADALKVWLLKQKQTQNWKTTKATADACYALLLNGSDWLSASPVVTIHVGKDVIRSTEIKTEAGTGYFKKKYSGPEVSNEMGTVTVKVENGTAQPNEGVSWGAVYWQYFEDLDKITAAATPLSIKKQLFIERNTDRGPVLTEIKEGNGLNVGDKVKVRIELRVDRDMEYVHMKDMRAACMEPVNVLSGYKYQGGLGYYESTKDISTNFFFDYLRKGTYVFEYPVFVTAKGNFSNGITTIQSMYAPEFSSHSEGIRVQVK